MSYRGRVEEPRPAAPVSLRIAVAVLWVQAAGTGALAAFLGYEAATTRSTSGTSATALIVFMAGLAGLLALLGLLLSQRRRPARGPAIVLEMLLVPVGFSMIRGGATVPGIVVVVLGVLGAGALLAPATRAALGIR